MFHGASTCLEILVRTLDRVWHMCRQAGAPYPKHLWLQTDNTTSQAKNAETLLMLAALVARRKFRTVSMNFLRVGHTHEDIDQLFAMLYTSVLRQEPFQTPDELRLKIMAGMSTVIGHRGEDLGVFLLTHLRDWRHWVEAALVRAWNCFLPRLNIDVPHSFTLKGRLDLNHAEAERTMAGGDEMDVFCLVKHFMSDIALLQDPELILPRESAQRLPPCPTQKCQRGPVPAAARIQKLHELANALEALTRSLQWVKYLVVLALLILGCLHGSCQASSLTSKAL